MNENAGWQKTLIEQEKEIPLLEKMLGNVMIETDITKIEENEIGVDSHFRQQLIKQHKEFEQLNKALNMQQKRLAEDSICNLTYDTQALCSQDILRDRIKDAEKNYVELKCNFMKYLSSVL